MYNQLIPRSDGLSLYLFVLDEKSTSTCYDSQRVEQGRYVCEMCGVVANDDRNGAENIRQKVFPNPAAFDRLDRDTGWLASPERFTFWLAHKTSVL